MKPTLFFSSFNGGVNHEAHEGHEEKMRSSLRHFIILLMRVPSIIHAYIDFVFNSFMIFMNFMVKPN